MLEAKFKQNEPDFAIITPTYLPHFKYISQYLISFNKYVTDKAIVPIYFIISKTEHNDFKKIIAPFIGVLKIQILYFEDILLKNKILDTPDQLLKKYGRYSFQTLKKFYAMLYIKKARYLVLDSESCWIKPVKMAELFDAFFQAPYIPYSPYNYNIKKCALKERVMQEADYILDVRTEKWYIECFAWFYDYRILEKMFEKYGMPIEIVKKGKDYEDVCSFGLDASWAGVFEILVYCIFIEINNDQYGYKLINMYEEYKKYLTSNHFNQYVNAREKKYGADTGFAERFMDFLTKDNIRPLEKLYNNNDFRIIMCQTENLTAYRLQKQFLMNTKVCILAASQTNMFLPNPYKQTIAVVFMLYPRKICEFIKSFIKKRMPILFKLLRDIRNKIWSH